MAGVLAFLVAGLAVSAGIWWVYREGLPSRWLQRDGAAAVTPVEGPETPPAAERPAVPSEPEPGSPPEAAPAGPGPLPPPAPAPPGGALVSLVIDDLGRRLEDAGDFEGLGVPVTFAVLPFETRTPEVVGDLSRRRLPYLLHLPMEGRPGADPGLGALTLEMSAADLRAATRAALAAVPGAVGVNNHMGSAVTADAAAMERVLDELADQGLFFLDSRTTADSVAYRMALERGLPAAERQVFLDPDGAREAIRAQFLRLLGVAHDQGSAIAIGHPHPATLEVLAEEVPRARGLGYRFVPVSALVEGGSL